MLAWELVGAVVGAGLASGREIASFFARYSSWSWFFIILAVALLIFLANTRFPRNMQSCWFGRIWRGLLTALLIGTGGAMLSGAGEVAALTLPVHGAYWLGMILTFILAWLLANRTTDGLGRISRMMLVVLATLILLGLTIEPIETAVISRKNPTDGFFHTMAYSGFNAALMIPLLATQDVKSQRTQRAVLTTGMLMLTILCLGNAVLQRHAGLIAAPMPFLKLMNRFGKFGYVLGAVSLYLAILSTLTACIRGVNGRILPCIGIAIISLAGFSDVIDQLYPLLGGASFLMLGTAKFLNWRSTPFHSSRDMI